MQMKHPRLWALVGVLSIAVSSSCGGLSERDGVEGGDGDTSEAAGGGGHHADHNGSHHGGGKEHGKDWDKHHTKPHKPCNLDGVPGHDHDRDDDDDDDDNDNNHHHADAGHPSYADAGVPSTSSSSSGGTEVPCADAGVPGNTSTSSSSGGMTSSTSTEIPPVSSSSTMETPDAGSIMPAPRPTCAPNLIPFVVEMPANGSYSDGWLTVWLSGMSSVAGSWNSNVGVNQVIVESAANANVDFMYEVSSGVLAGPMNPVTNMPEAITRITYCYDKELPPEMTSSSSSGGMMETPDAGPAVCPGGLQSLSSWHFEITRNGNTFSVPALRDNVREGDHVAAVFTVTNGCSVELALASYTAPNGGPGTELDQHFYDGHDGSFTTEGRLEIDVPPCFYQVDFALGRVIHDMRTEGTYGIRLIDADNGGTSNNCTPPSTSSSSSGGVSSSSSTMSSSAMPSSSSSSSSSGMTSSSTSTMHSSSSTMSSSSSTVGSSSSSGPAPCTREGRMTSYRFEITRNGQTFTVTNLRDHTRSGDHIKAIFTIAEGCKEISFVAYLAPSPCFSTEEAHLQTMVDYDTGTYGPGTHTQEIDVPGCFYQVDFVKGAPIPVLDVGGFYSPQGRLISADNGGSQRCTQLPQLSVRSGSVACPSGKTSYRIEDIHNGQYTQNNLTVTLSHVTSTSFEWSANRGVDEVIVKGGTKSQLYVKDDMTHGVGMSPMSGSSHPSMAKITFCY